MSHEATRLAWLTKEPQHGARLVLLALADHHNASTNLCCPSVARLVETTRLERKAVLRAIAELEHHSIISTKRKNGCGSRYTLHFLDQSQNGTGDKMGPVLKGYGTGTKMGRDQSQNGTRNRKEPGRNREMVVMTIRQNPNPPRQKQVPKVNPPPRIHHQAKHLHRQNARRTRRNPPRPPTHHPGIKTPPRCHGGSGRSRTR